ncbi:MAG: hypothetical protein WC661_01415 [Opitutaceae bacterium]
MPKTEKPLIVVQRRWTALMAQERPKWALWCAMIATVAGAAGICLLAGNILSLWAILSVSLGGGIGIVMQLAGRTVHYRYGFFASGLALFASGFALVVGNCGVGVFSASCAHTLSAVWTAHPGVVLGAMAGAVILAYVTGFRRVGISELLRE